MSQQREVVFAQGMIVKNPREGAPSFVLGSISINCADFYQTMQQYAKDGWLNLELCMGQSGKPYAKVDTWQPQQGHANPAAPSWQGQQAPQPPQQAPQGWQQPQQAPAQQPAQQWQQPAPQPVQQWQQPQPQQAPQYPIQPQATNWGPSNPPPPQQGQHPQPHAGPEPTNGNQPPPFPEDPNNQGIDDIPFN